MRGVPRLLSAEAFRERGLVQQTRLLFLLGGLLAIAITMPPAVHGSGVAVAGVLLGAAAVVTCQVLRHRLGRAGWRSTSSRRSAPCSSRWPRRTRRSRSGGCSPPRGCAPSSAPTGASSGTRCSASAP
nr:hypothetical protein [Angustibacter aerolatus]